MRRSIPTALFIMGLAGAGVAGACSSSSEARNPNGKGKDGGVTCTGACFNQHGPADGGMGSSANGISITPAQVALTINPADGPPASTQFVVHGAEAGAVGWHSSNPNVGTIDSNGLFTPTGQAGGLVRVEATVGTTTVYATVTVTINYEQNGGGAASLDAGGAGGLEGVGGEGFGGTLPDDVVARLKGTPETDAALSWLYPYDQTVFPLAILPPLLQWSRGSNGNYDALYIHISAGQYYDYKGFFGRPALLGASLDFVRHPIPADVWKAASQTAAGNKMEVSLVLSAGGKAYGPIKETYPIALAPINGRVYYQAYATAFVKNSIDGEGLVKWDNSRFGAATLSIDVGAEAPKLVAGADGDATGIGCRVCHSVSAYGDRMAVQHGNQYDRTSSYDLKNGNAETVLAPDDKLGWPGYYPDGTMALSNTEDVTGSESNSPDAALYDMATGAAIPAAAGAQGITDFVTRMALPAFSPDGKHAAFAFVDGPSAGAIGGQNGRQLVSIDFDLGTHGFTNPQKLWEAGNQSNERPAFVTFLPSSDAVVFERRWAGDNDYSSWHGAQGELWWVDLGTKTTKRLDAVMGIGPDGKSYLPTNANGHDHDETLSFDPSISPVASGGYAWMVFMSRRLYGNVATSHPEHSDPREYDTHAACTSAVTDPCYTTKKIWMAAIDLNPTPGTDPSHPAFYIPGQEIKGTNSRPFFALQPCISDAGVCSTGVDCCSGFCYDGYCRPPKQYECSKVGDKCSTTADCCPDTNAQCIGGFCAVILH
jgi:hypothetical protein